MKSNNRLSVLNASVIMLLIFSTSCYYDQVLPVEGEAPETVSFATDVEPIFYKGDKCTRCHSPNESASFFNLAEGAAFNNLDKPKYVNKTSPDASLIYTKAKLGAVHSANYTTDEAATVLKWIEIGALDN